MIQSTLQGSRSVSEVLSYLARLLPSPWRLPGARFPLSWKPPPVQEPTLVFHRFEALPPATGSRQLGNGRTLLVHHPYPRPPTGSGLTVMTYNILLGGQRRGPLVAYFDGLERSGRLPDVIGLQEASQPVAVLLAEWHGFHLAYFGRDEGPDRRLVNGKAILSRYPLLEAVHFTYGLADAERQAAIDRRGEAGELVEDRGVLRAVLDVHGRRVAVYDLHHALGDPGINANNLRQLNALLRTQGDEVAVVLGDFNANTLVKHHGRWNPVQHHHDTHTIEGYRKRYGQVHASVGDPGVGNIGDRRVRSQLHALAHRLPATFTHASLVQVRLPDGSLMRPVEARAQLDPTRIQEGSPAWQRLQDVADASTLSPLPGGDGVVPSTGKRFDSLYASPRLEPLRVEVDQTSTASDHLPVLAAFYLR